MTRPGARQVTRSGDGNPRRRVGFLLGCGLVAALQLWLVWPDETVARANPLDQQRFAEMAHSIASGHWLGPYTHRTLIREPAFPTWVAAVSLTGVPLRVAMELLQLGAALAFAAALRRAGASAAVALAVYAVLALQPHGLVVNRELLPAGFYASALLVGLAGLLFAATARGAVARAFHAGWAGIALGLVWTSRPEKPLVLLPVAIMALGELARRARAEPFAPALGRAATLALAPVPGILAVTLAFAVVNDRHYGVFDSTEVTATGYLAANRALTAIAQSSPKAFVPVPREARERAYAASPALRELSGVLEGPSWARNVSCNIDRVCDDIGAGYFRWLLREAAADAGHAGSAAETEAFFARVADELAAACDRGELPCRDGTDPFLHPYPSTWLPNLLPSLRTVIRRASTMGSWAEWDPPGDHPATPPGVRRLFDSVASRRAGLVENGTARIAGRATADEDPVVAVVLRAGARRLGRAQARPGETGVTFRFEVQKTARVLRGMTPLLHVERASGARVRVPLYGATVRPVEGVHFELEPIEETGRDDAARRALRLSLWAAHTGLLLVLSSLTLFSIAILLLPPWRGRRPGPLDLAAALLLAVAAARFAMLVLVDASSFHARSSRYLYPVVSLYSVGLLLLGQRAVARLRRGPASRADSAA